MGKIRMIIPSFLPIVRFADDKSVISIADESPDILLNHAMLLLAQNPRVIFIGQNVVYDGNVLYRHLEGISRDQRLELPVAEELQMGMSIGLALQGFIPISIYPRMDFLMLAMNQLVNHLDKLPFMTNSWFSPKVIIRTKVGNKYPLNAGPQHTQNHTKAFEQMLKTIHVIPIRNPSDILPSYRHAMEESGSYLMVEMLEERGNDAR